MGKGVTPQRAGQILIQAVHRIRQHNSRRGLLRQPYMYDEELERKIRKKELENEFGILIPGERPSLPEIEELYEEYLQACKADKVPQVSPQVFPQVFPQVYGKGFLKELADFYNLDTNDVELSQLERRLLKRD